jgi:putative DNA methylase
MTGPTNDRNETTWGGLAKEVRYWGEWVLKKVKAEIGDVYPLIPDPAYKGKREPVKDIFGTDEEMPTGYLLPVAHLWTRTVTCKNPTCKATAPLVRQTWLCKKQDRHVALKMTAPKGAKRVRFEVVEAKTEKALGFDPAGFSKAGNASCPFCGTVADNDHAKEEGKAGRMCAQPMAVVCTRPGARGKVYLAADGLPPEVFPDDDACRRRIAELCQRTGLTVPDEPIINDAKNANFRILYGLDQFSKLFTSRQLLSLLTFVAALRDAYKAMVADSHPTTEHSKAVTSLLACWVDRLSDFSCTLCTLKPGGERGVVHAFTRQAIPMI